MGKSQTNVPMWLCIFWGTPFEETIENTQWRKVKQMQAMWLCICWGKRFEETFKNTQWGKVKQMHYIWLCLCSGKPSFENFRNVGLFENHYGSYWAIATKGYHHMYSLIWGDHYAHPNASFENWNWNEDGQLQSMRLCKKQFEQTYESSCKGKVIQVQPMLLCSFSER